MCAAAAAVVIASSGGIAQVQLISIEDEIRLGRQSQQEVRKQVPELQDREVRDYVASVGSRLARRASGPRYPYSFTVAKRLDRLPEARSLRR